jgi:predicted ester cyclase
MSKLDNLESKRHSEHRIEQATKAFNAHDLDRWMDFYAADAVHIQLNQAEPLRGQAEIREDYRVSTWIPFPDFHFALERVFSENGWVCVQGIFSGTHAGPLSGLNGEVVAPTHRQVRIPLCLVIQLEAGRAVRVHEYSDQRDLLNQLGLIS